MRDKKLNEHGTCKILEREWLGKRGHIHTVSWLHRMWFMMTSYLISGIKNKFHFLSSSTWLYYHLLLLLKLPPIYLFLPFFIYPSFCFWHGRATVVDITYHCCWPTDMYLNCLHLFSFFLFLSSLHLLLYSVLYRRLLLSCSLLVVPSSHRENSDAFQSHKMCMCPSATWLYA